MRYLLVDEVVFRHFVQLRDERGIRRLLGAGEDRLEDGLVLSIDVVVLKRAT